MYTTKSRVCVWTSTFVHCTLPISINVEPIISHRYRLDEIWDAFKFANTREGIKVMVVNEGVE